MSNKYKRTLKDVQGVTIDEHDEFLNAKRVTIVGSDMSDVAETIKASLSEGLKDLKVEVVSQKEQQIVTKIETITVPSIVKEIQVLEVPTIVREVEIRFVDVPVIVKEIELKEVQVPIITQSVVTIEKPVIVEKLVQQDLGYIKYLLIAQVLVSFLIGLALLK